MRKTGRWLGVMATVAALAPASPVGARGTTPEATRPASAAPSPVLPLRFEANRGQAEPSADFVARCGNFTLLLERGEAVFSLGRDAATVAPGGWSGRGRRPARSEQGSVVRMRWGGESRARALGRLPGVSHYLLGNDASKWMRDVPAFEGAVYRDVRPGVDLVFRGNPRRLEYDLRVSPGGDPASLVLTFEGAATAAVDGAGDLVLGTPDGELRHGAPVAWQEAGGRRVPVPARWTLEEGGRARIATGPFDRGRPLVVDPTVSYGTYLGGGDLDTVWATFTDGAGALHLAGWTRSSNYPTASPYQGSYGGGTDDAFVSKFSANGQSLLYSTYVGGSGFDEAFGIHVDGSGGIAIAGITSSTNFPTVNPFLSSLSGGTHDAFLARIAPGGASLTYGSYYGGTGFDDVWSFTVAPDGTWRFSGATSSPNLPLAAPAQAGFGGGSFDAYAVSLDVAGGNLVHATYLGGTGNETATALAVGPTGASFLGGFTTSTNFPVFVAAQPGFGGGSDDAFCASVPAAGGAFSYCTYFGGSGFDEGTAVVVDAAGRATLAGFCSSSNLSLVGPFQPTYGGGGDDAFLVRFSAAGNGTVFASYLGGSGFDQPYALSEDPNGALFVGGFTYSSNFPTRNPIQTMYGGGLDDAFVAKVSASGATLEFSTFLGGSGYDEIYSVRAEGTTAFTVAGISSSNNLPVANAYQQALSGGVHDGFAFRYVLVPPAAPSGLTATPQGLGPVRLAWTDGSLDEFGFGIERREPPGSFAPLAQPAVGATTYDDAFVAPGKTYVYRVRSLSWEGSSTWSNEATVSTPYKPAPPSGFQALSVSPYGIDLSWVDGSDNEVGFEITRRVEEGSYSILAITAAGETARQDLGLLPDTDYTYRIRAFGDVGTSAYAAPDATAQTAPSVALVLVKGSLKDSTTFGKDKASVTGTLSFLPAAVDQVFDPVANGMGLAIGDPAAPIQVTVPAASEWKEKKGKFTWKSPKGSVPKVSVTFVPATGEIKAKLSSAQFPAAPGALVRWSVRGGNDGGTLNTGWTVKKPGTIAYP